MWYIQLSNIPFYKQLYIWEREELPCEWKRAVIVPLHKKNDKLDCANYRGISLLCQSSKIFSSIILQRIKARTEEILSEAQAGFRRDRSTIDQIFTLKQLAEKFEEFGKELYVCYIDLGRLLIAYGERVCGTWCDIWILGKNCKDTGKCVQEHIRCSESGWRYIRLVCNYCRSLAGMCTVAIDVQHLSGNEWLHWGWMIQVSKLS